MPSKRWSFHISSCRKQREPFIWSAVFYPLEYYCCNDVVFSSDFALLCFHLYLTALYVTARGSFLLEAKCRRHFAVYCCAERHCGAFFVKRAARAGAEIRLIRLNQTANVL